jgi:hypothetical protein
MSEIDTLSSFTINSLPNLDTVVMGALELFSNIELPKINTAVYKKPLVVGSGNAEATAKIVYAKSEAIFASESNFEQKLIDFPEIDGVVIVSASGSKHAPVIAKVAKRYNKHVSLITNTADSPASLELDNLHEYDQYVLPKNREPFTYNTSTYMGMILGATGENPATIADFIKTNTAEVNFPDLSQFNKYYFIVPNRFSGIIRMLQIKFIELFGRNVANTIETVDYVIHATALVPSDELFVSFGEPNTTWGVEHNRITVPLPENCDYAAMMAIGYWTVGQIQKAQPQYFKQNVEAYCQKISLLFGTTITPIVD